MAINIMNRKLQSFRCFKDPMVGPMPRNAFHMATHGMEAEMLPQGVYVKVIKSGMEHVIPYANVESMKLEPKEEEIKKA